MTPLAEKRLYRIGLHAALIGCGALLVIPFYWMIITSFKGLDDIFKIPISFAPPSRGTLDPYRNLLQTIPYLQFMRNTLIITLTATAGQIFFCSLAGYAFSKHKFDGRNVLFLFLLSTMMVPDSVLLVPNYLLMKDFHWLNTYYPLIVPGLASIFGIFLCKQFIDGIPQDFVDAARIDGCGEFRIFTAVIVPLAKPVLATLGILAFLGQWNSFQGPLIYLMDESKYTLQLGIALLLGRYSGAPNIQMAGATLGVLPVLAVFFGLQRQIIASLSSSGIKSV